MDDELLRRVAAALGLSARLETQLIPKPRVIGDSDARLIDRLEAAEAWILDAGRLVDAYDLIARELPLTGEPGSEAMAQRCRARGEELAANVALLEVKLMELRAQGAL